MLAHVCRTVDAEEVSFFHHHAASIRDFFVNPKPPVRDTLDIWPPRPLVIRDVDNFLEGGPPRAGNNIAALGHNDRVCQIRLCQGFGSNAQAIPRADRSAAPHICRRWMDRDQYSSADSFLGRDRTTSVIYLTCVGFHFRDYCTETTFVYHSTRLS